MPPRWASFFRPFASKTTWSCSPNAYCFRIKEIEAGHGELRPGMLLAINPGGGYPDLEGEQTKEPAFGLPAVWISELNRQQAMLKGCTVVDLASVLITHLTELVRGNLDELLSYSETQKLLDGLARSTSVSLPT